MKFYFFMSCSIKLLIFTFLIIVYTLFAVISVFLGRVGSTSKPEPLLDTRSSTLHAAESWSTTHSG